MRVLAIETSCDETAVAVYDQATNQMYHRVHSQIETHAVYGGVVPELASRDHFTKLSALLADLGKETPIDAEHIDRIAYTSGPGLAGALMVGAAFATGLAYAWDCPVVPIHHLEGHLMAAQMGEHPIDFPFLALLVSGGHTQLIEAEQFGVYHLLGETIDDAVGEAFDKTAKLLGLGYPGGPALAALAEEGDAVYELPHPLKHQSGFSFSFSGLKTAVRQLIQKSPDDRNTHANIAASFQKICVDILVHQLKRAMKHTGQTRLVVAGGVGANKRLRAELKALAEAEDWTLLYPPAAYCTDNAAMIAIAGSYRSPTDAPLTVHVRPRWPMMTLND